MLGKVISITAVGTRGKVVGKSFEALQQNGKYVLHSEALAAKSGKAIRFAINKVCVTTLDEAANFLAVGGYHIRVFNRTYAKV